MLFFLAHKEPIVEFEAVNQAPVTVEPGINHGKLQQTLQRGWFFATFSIFGTEYCTIGGVEATMPPREISQHGDTRPT